MSRKKSRGGKLNLGPLSGITHGTKFFNPGESCLDAKVEIQLDNGTARLVVREIGATEPGNYKSKMNKDGMSFVFGKESCRIAVNVAPVKCEGDPKSGRVKLTMTGKFLPFK